MRIPRSRRHPGTTVDGELVAIGEDGQPSFNLLHNSRRDSPVVFYAFDVLAHGGEDVKALPLNDRLSVLDSAFIPSDCCFQNYLA
jgi:ATP-dependent DNA ligase